MKLRIFSLLFLFFIFTIFPVSAFGDQKSCTGAFLQMYRFGPENRYTISRTCTYDYGGRDGHSIIYNGTWNGSQAFEKIKYTYNRFHKTGQLYETITGEIKTSADCNADPWLYNSRCTNYTIDKILGSNLDWAIGGLPYPISPRLLSVDQRQMLRQKRAEMTDIGNLPVEILLPQPNQWWTIDLKGGRRGSDQAKHSIFLTISLKKWPDLALYSPFCRQKEQYRRYWGRSQHLNFELVLGNY